MSDIELVIKIPEEVYKSICKMENPICRITLMTAIAKGTPLPKSLKKQIEDLWIYVKWHEITDKEKRKEEYPQDWVVYIDSPMPADEEEILVYTKYGAILRDVSYFDDGYSLESGYDWVEDVIAWMPLSSLIPESYREVKNVTTQTASITDLEIQKQMKK